MGKRLLIESLEVRTETHTRLYEFGPGVNAITGPIGSGKSSMLELLKYGLGGSAKVMPAVRDNVRTVILRVRVGDEHWEFTRALGSPILQIYDLKLQESLGEWAATNRQNMRRVGPELMRALDLPADWRIPRSRKRPTDDTVPVSFWDVHKYLYLDQNRIDQSVIGHDDANLNNKRIAVFELLYGLANARTVELLTERGRRRAEAKRLHEAALSVARFLEDMGEPNVGDLRARRLGFLIELAAAHEALEQAKRDAEQGLVARDALSAVNDARARHDDLTSRQTALANTVEEAESVVAQLDLEEQRLKRGASANKSLSGLEFVQCPRCLQSLPEGRFDDSHCHLCGQPQESLEEDKPVDALLRVVREQRRETRDLLAADRKSLLAIGAEAEAAHASLLAELRRVSGDEDRPTLPYLAIIEDATTRVAACEAALSRLDETESRWATQSDMNQEAKNLEVIARDMAEEEARLKLELSENTTRLTDLSGLFAEVLASLRDPWFTEAHVDSETYLPVVDGEKFDMLAVGGGRKTIVNLSYHLANLYMSISEGVEMLMPTFLVVDSPRKNVGEGALDRSVVAAIYGRLRTLQAASPGQFQIIFADNDMPPEARKWVSADIALDYDNPLVPGVRHRGQEEAPMDSEETEVLE